MHIYQSNPGIEPRISCVKSENVVITVTTPTPLATRFYIMSQKLASRVNIFMCIELNTTSVTVITTFSLLTQLVPGSIPGFGFAKYV